MRRTLPLFAIAVAACADGGTTPGSGGAVVTEAGARALVESLAADSMQGRLAGSAGERRAATLIAARMAAAGLAPGGDSGYFQRVPMRLAPRTMSDGVERLRPLAVTSLADLDTVPVERRAQGLNVVGILRGAHAPRADSALLVTAHFDHLGMGPPAGTDSIYNGADDNASGTGAMLESARLLGAGARPARTVVFVAFTGEEFGFIGSRWYASAPAVPLSRTVANLNIEMLARPDPAAGGAGTAWLTGYERSTMGEQLAAAGLRIMPDRRTSLEFFWRSDNIVFAVAGIPAHTLGSWNLHGDYHQPSDEADRLDAAHYAATVRMAAAATRLLAEGSAPAWKAGGQP